MEVILAKSYHGEILLGRLHARVYFGRQAAPQKGAAADKVDNPPPVPPADEVKCDRTDPFLIRCVKAMIRSNLEHRENLCVIELDQRYENWSIRTKSTGTYETILINCEPYVARSLASSPPVKHTPRAVKPPRKFGVYESKFYEDIQALDEWNEILR
jgi:hypothetical protein